MSIDFWGTPDDEDDDDNAPLVEEVAPLTARLMGHEQAEKTLLNAYNSGRFHHAWLLAGPRGIGKAQLAMRMAHFLLSQDRRPDLLGAITPPRTLDVAATDPVLSRIAARSHPGLLVIERQTNKAGKLASIIDVEQARLLPSFFNLASSDEGWRVVIIDSADDLNRSAINAILKCVEEPAKKSVLFIIAHAPGRLLPTLRSRCCTLNLPRLPDATVAQVLAQQGVPYEKHESLVALANGAPGQALRYASLDLSALQEAIEDALRGDMPLARRMALSESLSKADARYEAFLDLLQSHLAAKAVEAAQARMPYARYVSLWEQIKTLIAPAVALNDDPKIIVFQTLGLLSAPQPGTA